MSLHLPYWQLRKEIENHSDKAIMASSGESSWDRFKSGTGKLHAVVSFSLKQQNSLTKLSWLSYGAQLSWALRKLCSILCFLFSHSSFQETGSYLLGRLLHGRILGFYRGCSVVILKWEWIKTQERARIVKLCLIGDVYEEILCW